MLLHDMAHDAARQNAHVIIDALQRRASKPGAATINGVELLAKVGWQLGAAHDIREFVGSIAHPRFDLFDDLTTRHLDRSRATNVVEVSGGHVLVDLAGFKEQPPLPGADLDGNRAIVPDKLGDAPLLAEI